MSSRFRSLASPAGRSRAIGAPSTAGDRLRLTTMFALLGTLAVAVLVRLVQLQLVRGPDAVHGVRAAEFKDESVPAPRGRLLDRQGRELAYDRPVLEARAELTLRRDATGRFDRACDRAVGDLVWALGRGGAFARDSAAEDHARERLLARIQRKLTEAGAGARRVRIDVLVDSPIDDPRVVEALKSLDYRRRMILRAGTGSHGAAPYSVAIHLIRRYERVHPSREATLGVVGVVRRATGVPGDDRVGVSGLERLTVLRPRAPGARGARTRAGGLAYWTDAVADPTAGATVRTSLDLALQECADREIEAAAESVRESYGSPPEWGAMLLVDVETGGLLAAASYTAGRDGQRDRYGAFAPTHRLFEPGSVVKPLHMALALERGLIDWTEPVDCRPGYQAGQELTSRVGRLPRRTIRDSHANDVHTPHGVLVRSSNIGAVRLGLRLGPEGIEDYLALYGFGERTGVLLPGELRGTIPGERDGRPRIPITAMRPAEQWVYSGPSVCFGYQMHTTALQVARAFLTLVSGRQRRLHLVERIEVDGGVHTRPADPETPRFLSARTLALVTDALVDVVHDEHGTARQLGQRLDALGVPRGVFAGKTGTSEYRAPAMRWDGTREANTEVRTASFVGFAPAYEPRFLVVCVLQKVGASAFYGGKYAAPAAGRVLLRALEDPGGIRR